MRTCDLRRAVLVGWLGSAAAIAACAAGTSGGARPRPTRTPRASDRAVRSWPAAGVTRVVLRAGHAPEAEVRVEGRDRIEVSGRPRGGAKGYHSSDPNWKETAAKDWGLDFVGQVFGTVLVISSKNEIGYIHHGYTLDDVMLTVPAGVEVTRERRELSGQGAPDLSAPATP
jgi:hypothetical protein